ncbi:hypothetical protein PTI98_008487 [Pleurotus ostreatus]|nr:hypothetical protein PTI98_008487 [Pleurotus ostreatus]
MLPAQGPIPGGVIPFPKMPAMDNTLGAMFIGASLAMLLYGIICLQIFIYITSRRTRRDSRWTRLFIVFLLW